jgi:hypothetical protein
MTIAGGLRKPLLRRSFPQDTIDSGQAFAALLTAEAGG